VYLASKVICQKCGHTSEKVEDFFDITLIIKGMSDVKKSLNKYLEEELLTGENKYFCDKCSEKVDAKKVVYIRTLPPLLIFSLSRFDFDLLKGTRNKINAKFEYPESIDLKEFLEKNENNEKITNF